MLRHPQWQNEVIKLFFGKTRHQKCGLNETVPVSVFPPLYGRLRTASITSSLVLKAFKCHSILGSPLYWARPGKERRESPPRNEGLLEGPVDHSRDYNDEAPNVFWGGVGWLSFATFFSLPPWEISKWVPDINLKNFQHTWRLMECIHFPDI